jgi:hypothetical protein
LSERSSLSPPVYAKDLPEEWIQILHVHRSWRINCHPVESDDVPATESISDTEDWLNWNGDLDQPNDTEDNCVAHIESEIEKCNGIHDSEWPLQQDVCAMQNGSRLV